MGKMSEWKIVQRKISRRTAQEINDMAFDMLKNLSKPETITQLKSLLSLPRACRIVVKSHPKAFPYVSHHTQQLCIDATKYAPNIDLVPENFKTDRFWRVASTNLMAFPYLPAKYKTPELCWKWFQHCVLYDDIENYKHIPLDRVTEKMLDEDWRGRYDDHNCYAFCEWEMWVHESRRVVKKNIELLKKALTSELIAATNHPSRLEWLGFTCGANTPWGTRRSTSDVCEAVTFVKKLKFPEVELEKISDLIEGARVYWK